MESIKVTDTLALAHVEKVFFLTTAHVEKVGSKMKLRRMMRTTICVQGDAAPLVNKGLKR